MLWRNDVQDEGCCAQNKAGAKFGGAKVFVVVRFFLAYEELKRHDTTEGSSGSADRFFHESFYRLAEFFRTVLVRVTVRQDSK